MSYTVEDFSESLARLDRKTHGFAANEVVACLAAWGQTGDFAEWTGGFLLVLTEKRVAWLSGWCDTTGWGCQDGIEAMIHVGEPVTLTKLTPADWPGDLGYNSDAAVDVAPEDLNRYLSGAS